MIYGNALVDVEDAVNEVREMDWLAVVGADRNNGVVLLKWYRILAMDNATSTLNIPGVGAAPGRRLMLDGPQWPDANSAAPEVRAVLLPGAVNVATRPLRIPGGS